MEINWKNIRCKNCTKQIYMTRGGGTWFHMETSQSGCIMHGDHRAEPDMSAYFPDASLLTEARQALQSVASFAAMHGANPGRAAWWSDNAAWADFAIAHEKTLAVLARLREREGVKS